MAEPPPPSLLELNDRIIDLCPLAYFLVGDSQLPMDLENASKSSHRLIESSQMSLGYELYLSNFKLPKISQLHYKYLDQHAYHSQHSDTLALSSLLFVYITKNVENCLICFPARSFTCILPSPVATPQDQNTSVTLTLDLDEC